MDGSVGDVDGSVGDVDGSVGDVDGSVDDVDGSVDDVDGSVGDVDGTPSSEAADGTTSGMCQFTVSFDCACNETKACTYYICQVLFIVIISNNRSL